MRLAPVCLILCLSGLAVCAAERIPVEKFAAGAAFSRARLSPDGRAIAYVSELDGAPWLMILDLESRQINRINPGKAFNGMRREVAAFQWISDRRIAFLTTIWDGTLMTGVSAVDRDGANWKALSGPDATVPTARPLFASQIIHAFNDPGQTVLMIDVGSSEGKDLLYPDVVRVNTLTGAYEKVIENPGNVVRWVPDHAGVIRVGLTREGLRYGAIIARTRSAAGAPQEVSPPNWAQSCRWGSTSTVTVS